MNYLIPSKVPSKKNISKIRTAITSDILSAAILIDLKIFQALAVRKVMKCLKITIIKILLVKVNF